MGNSKSVARTAVIKNITFSKLSNSEFSLDVGQTKEVAYTDKVKTYAQKRLIQVVKIY